MIDEICRLPYYEHLAVIIITQLVLSLVEYWLGKTDKTKGGSIIEVIKNFIVAIVRQYIKRRRL